MGGMPERRKNKSMDGWNGVKRIKKKERKREISKDGTVSKRKEGRTEMNGKKKGRIEGQNEKIEGRKA